MKELSMRRIYVMPSCTPVALEDEDDLLANSGVNADGIGYGGVDSEGSLDPAAKRVNPFYSDDDGLKYEEE